MAGELTPRMSDAAMAVETRDNNPLPRVPRKVQKAVDAQVGRGLVRAARAQADTYAAHTRMEGAAYLAHTGMQHVAELSAEEERYAARHPLAEGRFRAIVDAYASLVCSEVVNLRYGR